MATAVQYSAIDASAVASASASSSSAVRTKKAGGSFDGGGGGGDASLGKSYNGSRTVPGKIFWKGRYIDHSLIYQVGNCCYVRTCCLLP